MIKMDDGTFGSSKAEKTLVKILAELNEPTVTAYVSRMLSNLSRHLKNIEITDEGVGTRKWITNMIKKAVYDQISRSTVPEEVRSYLENAATIRLRTLMSRKKKDE